MPDCCLRRERRSALPVADGQLADCRSAGAFRQPRGFASAAAARSKQQVGKPGEDAFGVARQRLGVVASAWGWAPSS
jgi:hypothetical protein